MTIKELINELKRYPQDTEISFCCTDETGMLLNGDFIFNPISEELVMVVKDQK